ncbi:hypothetical protein BDW02DRAFT_34392 [Decorospora gaudefroyi]|uniref:Uncharacterized protein n=1 Tax=Decorospora gaudefroyi TaxID=184978 RepID=A0A6A5KTL2_9PLEO|nr:hypothetical protein BDW02DRAFT_34392 [Decorospora gaudefroyi]
MMLCRLYRGFDCRPDKKGCFTLTMRRRHGLHCGVEWQSSRRLDCGLNVAVECFELTDNTTRSDILPSQCRSLQYFTVAGSSLVVLGTGSCSWLRSSPFLLCRQPRDKL